MEIHFTSFRNEGGRTVLSRMEIRHLVAHERGKVTLLEFLRHERVPLDRAIFTPERARSFDDAP
jgi:hypothetical protein